MLTDWTIDMILITGGLGHIGSHTARALLAMDRPCVLAQRRSGELAGAIVEQVDIADRDAFLDIARRHPITGIIHLAAAFGFVDPIEDALHETTGLLTVLTAARTWAVPRVLVASTIGVYGTTSVPPYREDTGLPLTGEHIIPTLKKVGEILADQVTRATDTDVISMRISAVWGPGGRPASRIFAAPGLVHAAVRGTPLVAPVYADDGADLCHVADCGRAIASLWCADTLKHRVYNVGSGRFTTNGEIVTALRAHVPSLDLPLIDGRSPNFPSFQPYQDISRLREDTGYAPEYDVERAVAEYVAWLRAGNDR